MEQEQFEMLIDKFIASRESKERQLGKYYASELGMCPRKLTFSYKYPRQMDKPTLRIMQVGEIFHDWIAKMLGASAVHGVKLLANERSITLISPNSEAVISGRLDDLIVVDRTGEQVVVDVKTIKSFDYLEKPKKEHILQVMMYLKALSIKKGGLLYIKKDDMQIKYFEFEYDPKVVADLISRADTVHKALTEGTYPSKVEMADRWQCRYCSYSLECAEADKKNVNPFEEKLNNTEDEKERDEIQWLKK